MNTDPKYEEEVSGCTASVGVISKDKIYVVCQKLTFVCTVTELSRQTRAIREVSWASRAGQSLFRTTTSPRTKVRKILARF